MIEARSKYAIKRRVTKEEYIRIWKNNIEFDNFSHEEIARAMTELCAGVYEFRAEEIADCEFRSRRAEGSALSKLYQDRLNYGLAKPELLKILFGYVIGQPEKEFEGGEAKRPVVRLMLEVLQLAATNFQPIRYQTWKENQESGFLGEAIG